MIHIAKEPVLSDSFKNSFPDLARVADGLEYLPFPELQKFLLKKEKESEKDIDILTINSADFGICCCGAWYIYDILPNCTVH